MKFPSINHRTAELFNPGRPQTPLPPLRVRVRVRRLSPCPSSRLPPPLVDPVRIALNNPYLREQGVPELRDCPAAIAASKVAKPDCRADQGGNIRIRLHYGDQPKPKGTGKLVT